MDYSIKITGLWKGKFLDYSRKVTGQGKESFWIILERFPDYREERLLVRAHFLACAFDSYKKITNVQEFSIYSEKYSAKGPGCPLSPRSVMQIQTKIIDN